MNTMYKVGSGCLLMICGTIFLACSAWGAEDERAFSVSGVLTGVYQYQDLSDAPGYTNEGRGLLVFLPEITFTPAKDDELFAKFGFGAGNGLMEGGRSPFALAPWGGNVEEDLKNINGRNRDYLLTVWYKHTFTFSGNHRLGLTGGIIDATEYLDENAFSNDEHNQFMNEALINGVNAFLPSYDIGAAVEWEIGRFSLKGVAMDVGSTQEMTEGMEAQESGPSYNFYGMQFGYALDSTFGKGNYRLILDTTSRDFYDVALTRKERLTCLLISLDQELGEILGAWVRFAWQLHDKAALTWKDLYSGGVNISGKLWHRESDNIGIGYAYLTGGNLDLDKTHVFEVYGRAALTPIFAITGDIQYMKDSLKEGQSPSGWIFGVRLTAEF